MNKRRWGNYPFVFFIINMSVYKTVVQMRCVVQFEDRTF